MRNSNYYQQVIQHHSDTCKRHIRKARDESLPWKKRMQAAMLAEEAQEKCSDMFSEAVAKGATDGISSPPRPDTFSLQNELFDGREGDPDLEPVSIFRRVDSKRSSPMQL
jgi:hypothetical protein